ncbi:HSP70-domain-containing protein [Nemania sp. FL0916]|nr:HSP70-domain-containing protein [Nemania sp. FL0916]
MMRVARPGLKSSIALLLLIVFWIWFYERDKAVYNPAIRPSYPESTDRVVGIDIGSAYSRVADGAGLDMRTYPNARGNNSISSCVAFTEDGPLVGEDAKLWAIQRPEATICNPRELLGRQWSEFEVQSMIKHLPYKVAKGPEDTLLLTVDVGGKEEAYTPEYVTSLLIRELKRMAEVGRDHEPVKGAVIAAPYHYNNDQRQALKNAGELAGVDVYRISKDPVSIPVAYRPGPSDDGRNIMIIDAGNTLDVSVVFEELGVFEVFASSHWDIGGKHFDQRMSDYLVKQWKNKTGVDLAVDPAGMRKLNIEIEKAKIALSSQNTTVVNLGSIHSDFTSTLGRSEFEALMEDSFQSVIQVIHRVLADARIGIKDVDDVLLAGGSGHIPKIREIVGDIFPDSKISENLNDEATVLGAAQVAAALPRSDETLCTLSLDILPFSLGIATDDGSMLKITSYNQVIPTRKRQNVSAASTEQTSMVVKVLLGERVLAENNRLIGKLEFPLTPVPAGVPRVEISLEVDANGVAKIRATELATQFTGFITIGSEETLFGMVNYQNESVSGISDPSDRAFLGNWPDLWNDTDSELRAEVNARVDLESYLAAFKDILIDNDKWGYEDVVKNGRFGHSVRRSEILRDIKTSQEDLVRHRDVWGTERLQELKKSFSDLAKPLVGDLEYELVYKVGGESGISHNEL